jgi:hypothetical protein
MSNEGIDDLWSSAARSCDSNDPVLMQFGCHQPTPDDLRVAL